VTIVDNDGRVVFTDLIHTDENTVTAVFASPATGVAYLI